MAIVIAIELSKWSPYTLCDRSIILFCKFGINWRLLTSVALLKLEVKQVGIVYKVTSNYALP